MSASLLCLECYSISASGSMSAIRKFDLTKAMMLFQTAHTFRAWPGVVKQKRGAQEAAFELAHVYLVSGYQCRLGRRDVVRLRSSALISFVKWNQCLSIVSVNVWCLHEKLAAKGPKSSLWHFGFLAAVLIETRIAGPGWPGKAAVEIATWLILPVAYACLKD